VNRRFRSQADRPGTKPAQPSIGKTWTLLGISIALLLGQSVVGFAMGRTGFPELALAVATTLLVASAVLNARASGIQVERRHYESESFGRLLQALSRSASPGAVIEAIVHGLGTATGADHVAVVQMRPGGAVLDVSFVSMVGGSPTSSTVVPNQRLESVETHRLRAAPSFDGGHWHSEEGTARPEVSSGSGSGRADTADNERRGRKWRSSLAMIDTAIRRGDDAREVADQIAYRLRDAYGLRNTLSAPLVESDWVVGAIVLSRRTSEPWSEPTVRLLNSAAAECAAALARVYSLQAAESEARTDLLTRLPNRRHFDEYCTLVASRRRSSDRVAILAIDVDHFKRLNDMYGHQTGDLVLQSIANAIQLAVRDEDLPARYGGEEFMVLLRNPTPGVALEVGERIRETVRETDLGEAGVTDRVTVSVGVASGVAAEEPISDIVERADRALYTAKRNGRDRVVEAR
jgi:diguanylate cyclase (GGDEF)-like protein